MPALGTSSTLNSWKHEASTRVSLTKALSMSSQVEYYHNQIAAHQFKDIFFMDYSVRYALRKFDLTLMLSNILNKKHYDYGVNGTMVSSYSTQEIRGRDNVQYILQAIKISMSFPIYKQYGSMLCGITCLQIICKYYVVYLNVDYLNNCVKREKHSTLLIWEKD